MTSNIAACLSSKRQDWGTPQSLFDRYNQIYRFDLDAAATDLNRKVLRFIGPVGSSGEDCVGIDALSIEEWPGQRIWLNPPYGRELPRWYAKVHEQVVEFGKLVAMLVPARTDTSYWHEFVWSAEHRCPWTWIKYVDFLKGRVKFEGAPASAPFPSAVVVFS